LLASLSGPGSWTALEGVVDGTLKVTASGEAAKEQLSLGGDLTIAAPRIAGAVVHDLDIRAQRWQLHPELIIGSGKGDERTLDSGRFTADFGFATVHGLPAAEAKSLLDGVTGFGFGFTLDVDALAAFTGLVPGSLQADGGKLQGTLAVPCEKAGDSRMP